MNQEEWLDIWEQHVTWTHTMRSVIKNKNYILKQQSTKLNTNVGLQLSSSGNFRKLHALNCIKWHKLMNLIVKTGLVSLPFFEM